MTAVRDFYLEERRQEILRKIKANGRVSVTELSERFGVSEVTVRADLQALADQELVIRTHGGAVRVEHGLQEMALTRRREKQIAEKDSIGLAGAAMIADGESVFLDSSSTALVIAQNLMEHQQVTVITNSMTVAWVLADAPSVSVVMPGGTMNKQTRSLIGRDGLSLLHQYNIQKGFFGAHGITLAEGLTDISAEEADVKKPIITMCREVFAVLDATKWQRVGLASFADVEDFDAIITDQHAPADLVAQIRAMGVQVILV